MKFEYKQVFYMLIVNCEDEEGVDHLKSVLNQLQVEANE